MSKLTSNRQETIGEENKFWSKVFKIEFKKDKQGIKKFSSYWWEEYYSEITGHINPLFLNKENISILEAGSGSGKASILLNKKIKKTLLDISEDALKYARYTAKKFDVDKIEYVQGDIFKMPFSDKIFDFTWNIGVLEHYVAEEIIFILREMIRVTRDNGAISVGLPNFKSGPIIKARILKIPMLKFLSGYRLGSEISYDKKEIIKLFKRAAELESRKIKNFKVSYFGNPLPMEAPKFIICSLGRILKQLFPKNKFLLFISCDMYK